MASSGVKDLENQLTNELGFPTHVSQRAAQICGDISDPDQRLMAAINFIETDEENVSPLQSSSYKRWQ